MAKTVFIVRKRIRFVKSASQTWSQAHVTFVLIILWTNAPSQDGLSL